MLKKKLKKKDGEFVGKIVLKSWKERFWIDLPMELIIGGEEEIDKIGPHHTAAYEYICDHEAEILQNILEDIFRNYATWQEEYGYNDASYEEKAYSMPDIENIDRLLSLITPKRIIILDIEKDGMAYYGVQFTCSWDQEHNLGAMLYKTRIVDIGGDDTAFLSWIAEDDLDNAEEVDAENTYNVTEYGGLIDESKYDLFEVQSGSEMYVHATYSCRMEDLIAFGTILYPAFVKIKDYIFIKSFLEPYQSDDVTWLEELEKKCNYCRKEVEMSVNSWSIGELFKGSGDAKAMDNEDLIREFCKMLEFSWKARAKELFPDREFAVETGYELMGELGFSITFYQK